MDVLLDKSPTEDGGSRGVPLLAARSLTKNFGGVHALRDANLTVWPGEVVGLVGENGAGKSTLLKILAGAHLRTSGEIVWKGVDVELADRAAAAKLGISIIFQHVQVVNDLDVFQNLTLGLEQHRFGWLQTGGELRRGMAELLGELGATFSLDAAVDSLSLADRQLVSIARALATDVRLLILDEPTASLGVAETERLFGVIRRLREEQRISVIYVSHYLEEVLDISDRVTVLRDGSTVGDVATAATKKTDLIELMAGRSVGHAFKKEDRRGDTIRLQVRDLTTPTGLSDIAFDIYDGEVLGVYGLVGSGRTELARAIYGADPRTTGTVNLDGREVRANLSDSVSRGVGFVSEDRSREGVFAGLSVLDNLSVAAPRLFSTRGWVNTRLRRKLAVEQARSVDVRASSVDQPIETLSGGNQQKVVIGRWLYEVPRLLILDDPTVGVDVGAKEEIYRLVAGLTLHSTSVLLCSSELPELLGLADRIMVLANGRVVDIVDAESATEEMILHFSHAHEVETV